MSKQNEKHKIQLREFQKTYVAVAPPALQGGKRSLMLGNEKQGIRLTLLLIQVGSSTLWPMKSTLLSSHIMQ